MRVDKALRSKIQKKTPARPPEPSGRVDKLLMEAVGAQVKTMRQAMKLTASQVAQAADLSVAMLSKIENGQTAPSLATLQALAIALNVPITALFTVRPEARRHLRQGRAGGWSSSAAARAPATATSCSGIRCMRR